MCKLSLPTLSRKCTTSWYKGPLHNFFIIAASMIAKTRITTEEEAKAALAERRRLAREQAEREAELEKLRLVRTCSLLLFQNLSSTV
jgi:hypothetical protein